MLDRIIYPAVFLVEDDGITVTFPDLKGCVSTAKTMDEAYGRAKEAMELYLEDYVKDMFSTIPVRSKLDDIHLKERECLALIELDVKAYLKTLDNSLVKKTLTIPAWLNEIATKKNINFSKLLKEALIRELK